MATVEELRTSINDMNEGEAIELIKEVRKARWDSFTRTKKSGKKTTKVKKTTQKKKKQQELTKEDAAKILQALKEKGEID